MPPPSPAPTAVGVIGGSGFYHLLHGAEEVDVDTPWGATSDRITVGELGGRRVAFVPRHGRGHTVPPHRINYRANLWALEHLGCDRILAPCAVGSLQPALEPGTVVVCDGLVNWTSGRADTYFEGPAVAHVSAVDPYCDELRPLAAVAAAAAGLPVAPGGTVVVVNGPRFSTRAESRLFRGFGWDVVNMTQYPEAVLARELGLCYVALALVTDHDSGVDGDPSVPPVTQEEILRVFRAATDRLREAITRLVAAIPTTRACACGPAPGRIDHA